MTITWESVREEAAKLPKEGWPTVQQAIKVGEMLLTLKEQCPHHGPDNFTARCKVYIPDIKSAHRASMMSLARHRALLEQHQPPSQRQALALIKQASGKVSKPRSAKKAAEPAKQEEAKPVQAAPLTEEKFELNEIVPSGRMTDWRIRTSKAARSPVLHSNIKNRLAVARDMFEIECDEDSSDQISQTVVDAITSIDEDPMFIAIVLKSLADRIYNDTLEQSKKKHLKSKSTKETV